MLILNLPCIKQRVEQAFAGNAAALASAWPTAEGGPDRSTINRWLHGATQPKTYKRLLGLAGALDLDPLALFTFEDATFPRLCMRVTEVSRQRSWTRFMPSLAFLESFIGPLQEWPPQTIAHEYFHRAWVTHAFVYPANVNRNYYGAVILRPEGKSEGANQVWHFAYRDLAPQAHWKPYGFVHLEGEYVRLYSFKGLLDAARLKEDDRTFAVETWFGQGAAEFRIASLHQFSLTLLDAAPNAGAKVRFD